MTKNTKQFFKEKEREREIVYEIEGERKGL